MTVSYNAEVATSGFFTFTKLLFKWRGSALKILWKDFVFFMVLYAAVALLYHLILNTTEAEGPSESTLSRNSANCVCWYSFADT